MRTCVSVVKVYRYFETHFNNRESCQHDVTRVFSDLSSWKHEALPVVRRLDQSENKRVYELENETTYSTSMCENTHCGILN